MAFENRPLTAVVAHGELGQTGVDHTGSLTLAYGEGSGTQQGLASLLYSLRANTREQTMIYGTQGHIRIHPPAHCPSRITLVRSEQRGGGSEDITDRLDFPLPVVGEDDSYNYPNQQGFCYQIAAVQVRGRDFFGYSILLCPLACAHD